MLERWCIYIRVLQYTRIYQWSNEHRECVILSKFLCPQMKILSRKKKLKETIFHTLILNKRAREEWQRRGSVNLLENLSLALFDPNTVWIPVFDWNVFIIRSMKNRDRERERETEEKAGNISVSLIERWQLTCYINFQVTQFDSSLRVSLITKLPSSTLCLYAIFFNFMVNFAPSCSFFSSFESGRKCFKFVRSIKN